MMIKKLLKAVAYVLDILWCRAGILHCYDLKFYEGTLNSYEECLHCGRRRSGWLR